MQNQAPVQNFAGKTSRKRNATHRIDRSRPRFGQSSSADSWSTFRKPALKKSARSSWRSMAFFATGRPSLRIRANNSTTAPVGFAEQPLRRGHPLRGRHHQGPRAARLSASGTAQQRAGQGREVLALHESSIIPNVEPARQVINRTRIVGPR